MNNSYLKLGGALTLPLLLVGCVDENYDLSDIDTNTRIAVNNLVIPLNLSDIVLDDVIDLSDNENIAEVTVDGKKMWAIKKSGEISSDALSIDPVHINAPSIPSNSIRLQADVPGLNSRRRASSLDNISVDYKVESPMLSGFSLNTRNIDDALVSVKNIIASSPIKLVIKFSLSQSLANDISKITFRNVPLSLPKGLVMADGTSGRLSMGTYNPQTGTGMLNGEYVTNGRNYVNIELYAEGLNAEMAGIQIENHTIDFSGDAGLAGSGVISLTPSLDNVSLPRDFTLSGDYTLSSFDVKTVSGTIDYVAEGIDIDPIDLSDLPDFLADPETDIKLVNPQVYLGAVNTTATYHTGVEGNVALESVFGDTASAPVRTEDSPVFQIGWDRGVTTYNIALAPNTGALDLLSDFPQPVKYTFSGLGSILSNPAVGEGGLPKKVRVSLPSLRFFGDALDFPVSQPGNPTFGKIDGLTGNYTFFAPLALQNHSTIVYSETEDGFSTEDLDKLTLNRVNLSAVASTNIPFKVELYIAVFNEAGERLGVTSQNMVIEPSSTTPVALGVTSTPESPIKGIHSIQYRARVLSGTDERPLSPDQYIRLSNLRITVDGYYDTDF